MDSAESDQVDRLQQSKEINIEAFDDAFVHFRHKYGSYWRWVRPVFDGGLRRRRSTGCSKRTSTTRPNAAVWARHRLAGALSAADRGPPGCEGAASPHQGSSFSPSA